MMRTVLPWFVLLALAAGGCSLIVDEQLAGKLGGQDAGSDSGPTGPRCNSTPECLMIADRVFDCTQRCVGASAGSPGVCVSDTAEGTADGTACGDSGGARICVARDCVMRECGDGYLDREAAIPEYCDDGDDNDANLCNNMCTRSCVPPARPDCADGNPCNGVEMCDTSAGLCRASRPAADGTPCTVDAQAGSCSAGACVLE